MTKDTYEELTSAMLELAMTKSELAALAEIIKDRTDQEGGNDYGYFLYRTLSRAAENIHGVWEVIDRATLESDTAA